MGDELIWPAMFFGIMGFVYGIMGEYRFRKLERRLNFLEASKKAAESNGED